MVMDERMIRMARLAMATRFELVMIGDDAVRFRAAGEEAIDEIVRLDGRLSFFDQRSEISRINAEASHRPVKVDAGVFRLLSLAQDLSDRTGGAFDPTVAPLMRCWGLSSGNGSVPDPEALAVARALTGMHRVHLSAEDSTVAFEREGMMLDLGSIGKGFAIDEAVRILREAGVTNALIHGGTSTAYAMGRPAEGDVWKVAVTGDTGERAEDVVAVVPLRDAALSVSAVWGKSFERDGTRYGHVLDPRLGHPVRGASLAAAVHASAAVSDALSTAMLVLGCDARSIEAEAGQALVVVDGPDQRSNVISWGFSHRRSEPAET